jgi:hypothetical protein
MVVAAKRDCTNSFKCVRVRKPGRGAHGAGRDEKTVAVESRRERGGAIAGARATGKGDNARAAVQEAARARGLGGTGAAGASAHTTSPEQVGRKVWGDRRQARECTHNKAKVWWNRRGRRERTHNKPEVWCIRQCTHNNKPKVGGSGAAASAHTIRRGSEHNKPRFGGAQDGTGASAPTRPRFGGTGASAHTTRPLDQAVNTAPRRVNSVLSCSRSCLVATSRGTYQLAAP